MVSTAPFVLAPTPAQLGKAPLQRRQSQGNCLPLSFNNPLVGSQSTEVKEEEQSPNRTNSPSEMEIDESLQEEASHSSPIESQVQAVNSEEIEIVEKSEDDLKEVGPDVGNSSFKCFFKKNVEDGMEK